MPRPLQSAGFGYCQQLAKRSDLRGAYLNELAVDASTGDMVTLVGLYLMRHRLFVPGYKDTKGMHIRVTLPELAAVTHDELRKVEAGEVPDWYCGTW
jgi:hypothetical protein